MPFGNPDISIQLYSFYPLGILFSRLLANQCKLLFQYSHHYSEAWIVPTFLSLSSWMELTETSNKEPVDITSAQNSLPNFPVVWRKTDLMYVTGRSHLLCSTWGCVGRHCMNGCLVLHIWAASSCPVSSDSAPQSPLAQRMTASLVFCQPCGWGPLL